jgi:CubicO group peptidase (beta-lactamase class C family)
MKKNAIGSFDDDVGRGERKAGFTFYQTGAIAAMLVVAVWGLAVLLSLLVIPGSADRMELTYFGTLIIAYLVLAPLYWKRVRWGYVAGIVLVIGSFVGAGYAAWEGVLFFSWSAYNLSVIIVYIIALTGLFFSYKSFRELPSTRGKRPFLPLGGVVLILIVSGAAFWSNAESIRASMLGNIDGKLQSLETLDEKIRFLMSKGNIPSLVAGIVVNDSLVWTGGYGADPNETVYQIASVTKPFVATAIMQLYEQNLIDLDADVNEYLPFSLRHPEYPDRPITIQMLLTHQSGLAHYTIQYRSYVEDEEILGWRSENLGWSVVRFDPYPSFAEFLEGYLTPGGPYHSPDAWSSSEPGTGFFYSSLGYDVLGYVVERVTDQSFTDYLQGNILDPLNMTSIGFSVYDFPERQAAPHERVYGVLSKCGVVKLPFYDRRLIGGGGMVSTVTDLTRFMIAHMNDGRIKGVQLLEPESVGLMHGRAVSFSTQGLWVGYGYGWIHHNDDPVRFIDMRGSQGHGGEDMGYQSSMWFVEEEQGGYGILLMSNINESFKPNIVGVSTIYKKIEELLLREASSMFSKNP